MKRRSLVVRMRFSLAAVTLAAVLSSAPASAQVLYVTDAGDNTVKKITPNGVVSTFISTGLSVPDGIVFDAQGNLYVANAGGNSISKYNGAGIQQTFTLSGELLNNPNGLTIDPSGNLYAVTFAANGIDTLISQITNAGVVSTFVADEGVNSAFDLVRDGSGNLYTDNFNNNTVVKYNNAGVAQPFTLSGDALNGPQGLTFDALGNLYVANTFNDTISQITSAGVVSTFISGNGLSGPIGAKWDSAGNLYVTNGNDSTISKYNSAGVQQTFTLSGDTLSFPLLIAIQPSAVSAAPEPGTLALLGLSGLPMVGIVLRRRHAR